MADNTTPNFTYPKIKEPLRGEWIDDEIPTISIKKAVIQATVNANTMRSSYTPSGTAHGLLTYLHLASNISDSQYALVDRGGTFDIFRVGTAVGVPAKEITLQGDWKRPIHAVKGTFAVYSGPGSQSAGSFTIAWELVQR